MAKIEIIKTMYPNGPYYSAKYVGFWNFESEIGTGYFEHEAIADLNNRIAERKATLKRLKTEQHVYTRRVRKP